MKKILITGANGFVGTALVEELLKYECEIIAVVKSHHENIDKIGNIRKISIVYCEMSRYRQLDCLISDTDIDCCIHLAWEGSTGGERADYSLQLNNSKYTLDLINVLAKMGVKRFVGAGTLAEKDVHQYHPKDGSTPSAVSTYGIAKMATHYMSKTECSRLNIEHIWCYISNTYGVGNRTNNFINYVCSRMLKGEQITFTEANQMYDFVYITDTVRAICKSAFHGKVNTAYYLGSSRPRHLREYIMIIRDAIDTQIELSFGGVSFNGSPLPPEAFDCSKLVKDTGYEAQVDFEDGIKRTIAWLRNENIFIS